MLDKIFHIKTKFDCTEFRCQQTKPFPSNKQTLVDRVANGACNNLEERKFLNIRNIIASAIISSCL